VSYVVHLATPPAVCSSFLSRIPVAPHVSWGAPHVIFTIGGEVMSIFTILFVVLLVAWLLGLSVFHVAGGLIHILLVFAVISLILHFVRGRRGVA